MYVAFKIKLNNTERLWHFNTWQYFLMQQAHIYTHIFLTLFALSSKNRQHPLPEENIKNKGCFSHWTKNKNFYF
jgi:hypothetical protein